MSQSAAQEDTREHSPWEIEMSLISLSQERPRKSSYGLVPFHPLVALHVFVALSFVIYIPVSILQSNGPLLILDALLGVALIGTLALRRKGGVRILGGSRLVLTFLALYVYSVLIGLVSDDIGSWIGKIQGVRSLLFGMGFLVLSSVWMNSARRVDGFLKVYLLGALFAALYGLRQFVFGLAPFELDRLYMFGLPFIEIASLGRTRIGSSFGEPATFAFVMMSAILILPITRLRPILPKVIQRNYLWAFGLLLAGLLMALVRGPLVALVVAAAFLFAIRRRRLQTKIVQAFALAIVAVVLVFALNYVVVGGVLADSEDQSVRAVNQVLTSVWSAIPMPVDLDSLTWQQRGLRTLSVTYRQNAWQEGLAFLLNNPLGGGIGALTEGSREIGFAITDVGLLGYGIELGWLGFFGFLGLFFSVPWVAYRKLKSISDKKVAASGRYLLALWVAYTVASLGAPYLHTEILSAVVWTVAGILLNLDVIAKSRAAEG